MTGTNARAAAASAARPPSLVRKLWGWVLDYAYVTYWMARAVLGRSSPDQTLQTIDAIIARSTTDP